LSVESVLKGLKQVDVSKAPRKEFGSQKKVEFGYRLGVRIKEAGRSTFVPWVGSWETKVTYHSMPTNTIGNTVSVYGKGRGGVWGEKDYSRRRLKGLQSEFSLGIRLFKTLGEYGGLAKSGPP